MKEGKRGERRAPSPGMLEKYSHIRGAIAFHEGRLDQAIRFFRKALALDEQAYTRAHLSLVYEAKGDDDRALKEITRAINLAPAIAEYYLRRSAIWERNGNHVRSDEDRAAAFHLDPDSNRIPEIREAAKAVRNGLIRDESDRWLDTVEVNDARLSRILAQLAASRKRDRQAVENRSCPVRCPAYCCHFSKDLFLHGVVIGPWKLHAIRAYLREPGIPEETLLEKRPISKEEFRLRLLSPDVVITEKGQHTIFYPKRSDRELGPEAARTIPPSTDYGRIDWITEESRACAFLLEGRCRIHDLAGEPALPACKEFLCLTGFIFLVVSHHRIMSLDEMQSLPIAGASRLAVEACLLLARRIYANGRTSALQAEIQRTIAQAIRADEGKMDQELTELLARYRTLHRRLTLYLSRQRKALRREIGELYEGLRRDGPDGAEGGGR